MSAPNSGRFRPIPGCLKCVGACLALGQHDQSRSAVHIGASGLVFGYFGYLVARGWYERKLGSILLAIAVIILYGGLILGVLPARGLVSWEGHLFGLIAGVLAARSHRR